MIFMDGRRWALESFSIISGGDSKDPKTRRPSTGIGGMASPEVAALLTVENIGAREEVEDVFMPTVSGQRLSKLKLLNFLHHVEF